MTALNAARAWLWTRLCRAFEACGIGECDG